MIGVKAVGLLLELVVAGAIVLGLFWLLTWAAVAFFEGIGWNNKLFVVYLKSKLPKRKPKQTRQTCGVCGYSGRHDEKLIFCPRCGFRFGLRGRADEATEEVPPNRPPRV